MSDTIDAEATAAAHAIADLAMAGGSTHCKHILLRWEDCSFGPCWCCHDGINQCDLPLGHDASERAQQIPPVAAGPGASDSDYSEPGLPTGESSSEGELGRAAIAGGDSDAPDRVQEAIASRFAAGDSIRELAYDFEMREDLVARSVRRTLGYLLDQHSATSGVKAENEATRDALLSADWDVEPTPAECVGRLVAEVNMLRVKLQTENAADWAKLRADKQAIRAAAWDQGNNATGPHAANPYRDASPTQAAVKMSDCTACNRSGWQAGKWTADRIVCSVCRGSNG